MTTKLASIPKIAGENRKYKFKTLVHLLDEDFLRESFRELKKDKASGIDGATVKGYEKKLDENIRNLVCRLKEKNYRPKPVKRVYIPKSDGTKRGLGIPAVEDKIVQMGLKKILEAIFEVDFLEISYGFRPNKSCHKALHKLNETIMTKPINYVVDMDIEKFFDTIDHKWLIRCLEERVGDKRLIRLIVKFLKAGIIEDGKYVRTDKGTPQGGVLSPILANIYLHYVLDLWFEKKFKKELKGYAQLIRYADDFVVCFQAEREAKKFNEELTKRVSKFGLKISEDKSKIVEFGRYAQMREESGKEKIFNFLGFTHYCAISRKGGFKVGRKTAKKRFCQKIKEMSNWLRKVQNKIKLKEWWKVLKLKLIGHYRYYGVSENSRGIRNFYRSTIRLVHKWINRNSQKKRYNWEQINKILKYNPLPEPKIYHSMYA